MKKKSIYILFSLFLFSAISCQGQSEKNKKGPQESVYTTGRASYDGIGKYYFGREIAHVMGHQGASWLERPEREQEERVSLLLKNLKLQRDEEIADIGAGTGYHSFRMAKKVPQGKVYAVDIQLEMIEMMREKKEAKGYDNVELVQSEELSPKLAPNSVDVVLIVDVYHEMSHPKEMMDEIVRAMRPGARFVLVEYRMEDPSVPIKLLHKMSEEQAVKEMKAVGLTLKENIDNLPWQHCMVFVKE